MPGSLSDGFIRTTNIEDARAQLIALGVEFDNAVHNSDWGRLSRFSDLDGNRWTLCEKPTAA